jgi:hypothetical protein
MPLAGCLAALAGSERPAVLAGSESNAFVCESFMEEVDLSLWRDAADRASYAAA